MVYQGTPDSNERNARTTTGRHNSYSSRAAFSFTSLARASNLAPLILLLGEGLTGSGPTGATVPTIRHRYLPFSCLLLSNALQKIHIILALSLALDSLIASIGFIVLMPGEATTARYNSR